MIDFFSQTPDSLISFCAENDLPKHAATQLLEWVYGHGVVEPNAMTNLSRASREIIAREIRFDTGNVLKQQIASDGTQKMLIDWPKQEAVSSLPVVQSRADPLGGSAGRETECVLIPTESRRTACISSQVGCPVGCRFCASGIGGLDGNLSAAQIVELAHRLARLGGGRITHVVFMGMGEPLANYRAVTEAIRTLNAPWGMGIGARRITISTVGLPAAIRRLVDFEIPVTLALSLHAPNDAIRRELIPWAEYATIDELLSACQAYFEATGREITLEYLLLRGVNDQPEHARELAEIAHTLRANVNLIRYNEVRGLPFDRPNTDDVLVFQRILRDRGVNAHIRASRGRDIAAACGQLRHERRTQSA